MRGYQVTFFTHQGARHGKQSVHDWLLGLCKGLGIAGMTAVPAAEGLGRHGRMHSAHFFELADQPMEIIVAVTSAQCDALFEQLEREGANLFYVKSEVEYGVVGGREGG